jgi:hypothetical protein
MELRPKSMSSAKVKGKAAVGLVEESLSDHVGRASDRS